MSHRRTSSRALVAVFAFAACSNGAEPPAATATVARLEVAGPLPATAAVGRTLTPEIRAVDATNQPVAGVVLRFATARGTTTLSGNTATTDGQGVARPGGWTLPNTPTTDTLVVTLAGGPHVAPLRIALGVRPGPVAQWVPLAAATGTGTVLQELLAGPAFQGFDGFGNPAAFAPVRVTATPHAGARVAATADADANGVVRIAPWLPRALGTYTLAITANDERALASSVLTREVRQPACAPIGVVPDTGNFGFSLPGGLGINAAAACADTVDRYALGVDHSLAQVEFRLQMTVGLPNARIEVLRAAATGPADVIVPAHRLPSDLAVPGNAGDWVLYLPTGEYELVVRRGPPSDAGTYTVTGQNLAAGNSFTWRPAYMLRGTEAPSQAAFELNSPEAGVPSGEGRVFVVPMRNPAQRQLAVSARATTAFEPVIAAYGRSTSSPTLVFLQASTGAGPNRTLTLDVPVAHEEVVFFVMQRRPLAVPTIFRFQVN